MRRNNVAGFIFSIAIFALGFSNAMAGEIQGPYFLDNRNIDRDPVTGIAVPPGFKATVFADIDGYARHMAVRDDGSCAPSRPKRTQQLVLTFLEEKATVLQI